MSENLAVIKENRKKDTIYYVKLLITFFLFFCFKFVCKPWGPVNELGVAGFGMFLAFIFSVTAGCGMFVPGTMCIVAATIHGVYESGAVAITSGLGSTTIWTCIVMYGICAVLTETGTAQWIAKFIISRKFIQGKPFLFTWFYFLACVVAGTFVSMSGIIFMYTIFDGLREEIGYEKDSSWSKWMAFGTFIGGSVGMAVIPYKGMPMIIFAPLVQAMNEYGMEIDMGLYMIMVIIFSIICVAACAFFMIAVGRPDMSKIKSLDLTQKEEYKNMKMTKVQLLSFLSFSLVLLYAVIMVVLDTSSAAYTWLNNFGQPLWCTLVLGIMGAIRLDGKNMIDPGKALTKGVDWSLMYCMATMNAATGALSNSQMGLKTWIEDLLSPIFDSLTFFSFLVFVLVVCGILTNFFSNTSLGRVVGLLTTPFIAQFAVYQGINPAVCYGAIIVSCMFAYLTLAASGSSPLLLTRPEFKEDSVWIWKWGGSFLPIGLICMFVVFYLFSFMPYTAPASVVV